MIKNKPSYELEDHSWFPDSLRVYQTDFLGAISQLIGLYKPAAIYLSGKIEKGKHIVDLASGSGKPAISAAGNIAGLLLLTDKFPNPGNVNYDSDFSHVEYFNESTDIITGKIPKGEVYTMFNSLHHFPKDDLLVILKKIREHDAEAYFFEPIMPTLLTFVKVAFSTLLLPFFIVPFIKPFRWDRLIYTYLFPIGILATFWDGMISVGKSYSLNELEKMKRSFENHGIKISVGKLNGRFTKLTYLRLFK